MYYQTCLFAIELERVAIEYLGGVVEQADVAGDELTAKAARTLIEEHQSIEQTLQERVGYSGEQPGADAGKMFDPSTCVPSEQFRLSREYIDMITAAALEPQPPVEVVWVGEQRQRGAGPPDGQAAPVELPQYPLALLPSVHPRLLPGPLRSDFLSEVPDAREPWQCHESHVKCAGNVAVPRIPRVLRAWSARCARRSG